MRKEIHNLENFIRKNSLYGMGSVGSEYWHTRDLDIKDVAKLIRKDIDNLFKSNYENKFKTSVKISRYAGGQSIRIGVLAPKSFNGDLVLVRYDISHILDKYNYDFSNPQYDYSSKRFFGFINIDKVTK